MRKRLKFDYVDKLYKHKPEFVSKNENLKILWKFEIKTGHQFLNRKSYLVLNKKKKKKELANYWILPSQQVIVEIKENKNLLKFVDLVRELEKLWNIKVTVIPIVVGTLQTVYKGLEKRLGELATRRKIETIQNTVVKISSNT